MCKRRSIVKQRQYDSRNHFYLSAFVMAQHECGYLFMALMVAVLISVTEDNVIVFITQ
jgi:hypothetical protein